jgi:hypothetical protein
MGYEHIRPAMKAYLKKKGSVGTSDALRYFLARSSSLRADPAEEPK